MSNKILSKGIPFYKMFYIPQSMLVYAIAVLRPLSYARHLDMLFIEVGIDITRTKRGILSVKMREPKIYDPTCETEMPGKVCTKYNSIITSVFTALSTDIERLGVLFGKALNAEVSEAALNSLDLSYFFGDLRDEVASFLRKTATRKYNPTQWVDFASKYTSIAFQRLAIKTIQHLAEMGTVLLDVSTPSDIRLLWLPNVGMGIYNVPSSKVQVLSLLKRLLPGFIDYSTDENEYTRLARLALKLNDDFDIDTLIDIIARLYTKMDSKTLQEWLRTFNLPKKYFPLILLSFILSKKNGIGSFIDFEGTIPIVIMYPKIPTMETSTEGGEQ